MALALVSFLFANFVAMAAAQNSGWLRYALCGMVVSAILESFRQISTTALDIQKRSVFGMFLVVWLSHILHLLLLEHVYVPKTVLNRWYAAYKILNTAREVGKENHKRDHSKRLDRTTTRKVLELAPGSSTTRIVWTTVVSCCRSLFSCSKNENIHRIAFLGKKLLSATIIYTVNETYERHLFQLQTYALGNGLFVHDFSPITQHFLRRSFATSTSITAITRRECIIRAWYVLHFVWTQWSTFTFLHDVLALLFVGVLRVDDPEDFPPFFGSPLETFTLQRFWSRFWHRAVRRTYTGYGKWISRRVLSLTSPSVLDRLVVHGFVFLFSGLIHSLVMKALHVCKWETDMWWFAVNFAAVTVEQALIGSVGKRFCNDNDRGTRVLVTTAWRVVGHLWVFLFMFWSLPNAYYPKLYCMLQAS